MRDYILLYINGRRYEAKGADVFLTLSDYLRRTLGLCGTKIVCSEGDCGSCSVLVGTLNREGQLSYVSIDSCIRFLFQLDGTHVVTVEGVAGAVATHTSEDEMPINAVQRAMIDCHGSQCGFCTPGFVVAMTGMLQERQRHSTEQWRAGLTGNLCRCTGYSPIISAGLKAQETESKSLNELYPPGEMTALFAATTQEAVKIEDVKMGRTIHCPQSLESALELLAKYPKARILAGATDVGVQFNKGVLPTTDTWIDLNRVSELEGVSVKGTTIHAGARATWSDLETIAARVVPEFAKIVSIFGSPQIRHVGTLGGNIINASPIADSLPLLLVCDAQLTLAHSDGTRQVNINDFYTGYKQFDLRPGELLTQIVIPLPVEKGTLRLYKVSRRRDLDISTFTAAIWIQTEGVQNGTVQSGATIESARIAYGAVGPTVVRLKTTETFLVGKPLSESTMISAGDIAVGEIAPISDVRGKQDYRNDLARNVLIKYFHQTQSSAPIGA